MENYTIYLPNRKAKTFWVDYVFLAAGIFWLVIGKYVLGILLILMAVIGLYANRRRGIHFTKEKVVYPSLPPKEYNWDMIQNVILKDDIITIDLKNNKIRQAVIDTKGTQDLNPDEFNNFCRLMLGRDPELS